MDIELTRMNDWGLIILESLPLSRFSIPTVGMRTMTWTFNCVIVNCVDDVCQGLVNEFSTHKYSFSALTDCFRI